MTAIIGSKQYAPKERRKVEYVKLVCLNCQQEFEIPPSWAKNGRRKFCSRKCKDEHQTTIKGAAHPMHGRRHRPESVEKMRRHHQAKRGVEHPSWKGGRWKVDGYTAITESALTGKQLEIVRPMLTKAGHILEHRLIMAMSLGRPLTAKEIVHHLDGDKANNRIENLQLVGIKAHSQEHREIERELSRLRAENDRLRSLLATFQNG